MSDNNQEATKIDDTVVAVGPEGVPGLDMATQIANLEKVNDYRMHMLRGQIEWDFRLGKPNKKGQRTAPTVRNNNRVFFDALDIMEGKSPYRSINEDEKRASATLVEYMNSLMLKIVSKKAKEQETANNPIENKGE